MRIALDGQVCCDIPWILRQKGAYLFFSKAINYTPDGIIGSYAIGVYSQKNEIRIIAGEKEIYIRPFPPYIGVFTNKDHELRTIRKSYQTSHSEARQSGRGIPASPRSRARSRKRIIG